MGTYFTLFIGAVLINNFVLTKFLGLCIFFGVSKNLNASIGMGFAVTAVITMSTILAWLLYNFVLIPFGLTFLRTITFVVLIASFVQLLEIVIKKQSPTLYNMWGIYLMLIATNCIVLSVPVISVQSGYNFLENLVFAIGSGLGFALALILMASAREKLDYADVPEYLKGTPVAFIVAGMLSLAFLGFSGMI
ncbi:MAG: RnfABCDGE type electron transport complex subunit A [Megasphaera sp.]|jgi:electron transport complex protein RnfA|nr:RnfABCDGE type electron transport complex subunit A [Megasphaera sp.]MCI1247509.1 RnfABCDGE type electron transport complex subunit A [Megasphaera sp.]